jgi:hypothetical protein
MLNNETVEYAFLLIRSAEGYARLVRCKLMRRVMPLAHVPEKWVPVFRSGHA